MQAQTSDFQSDFKTPRAVVLGATGLVGQTFVWLLSRHTGFRLAHVCASPKRVGMRYQAATSWMLPFSLPDVMSDMRIDALEPEAWRAEDIRFVFSALPSDVARTVEPALRDMGFWVFTNASALRRDPHVPILVPEANPEAVTRIRDQGFPDRGFVIANPNCATAGLAVALAPLRRLGIADVTVSTYQSVSGAGLPGPAHLAIAGNAIPHIPDEETKIIDELTEILDLDAPVFPTCVRVDTPWGHLETVWLRFHHPVNEADLLTAWREASKDRCGAIEGPTIICEAADAPQPRQAFLGTPPGMPVQIGRLRRIRDRFGFVVLVNNLVKGAAGGSIQNADWFRHRFGGVPCAGW